MTGDLAGGGLHVVSLFSGIGLLDLAFEQAGFETTFLCEIDPIPSTVLSARFPGVPLHTDVQDVTADDLYSAGAVPDRTVLAGGFPCTDLSQSGRRAGMERGSGTRSSLYWEIVRLVDQFGPRWLVLENVPPLLSSRGGRDMGTVVGSLVDRGYGLAWRVLDAQHHGVPQRRRRIVLVGHRGAPWDAPAAVLFDTSRGGRHFAAIGASKQADPGEAAGGFAPRLAATVTTRQTRLNQDDTLIAHALKAHPGGADLNDARGGKLVTQTVPIETASTLTSNPGGGGRRREDDVNLVAAFAENQRADVVAAPVTQSLSAGGGKPGQGYPAVLDSQSGRTVVRRLTPLECERLQGAPDGWTAGLGLSDTARYRGIGNGVAVPVFRSVAVNLARVDASIRSLEEAAS